MPRPADVFSRIVPWLLTAAWTAGAAPGLAGDDDCIPPRWGAY
jgi:hypothetical protein